MEERLSRKRLSKNIRKLILAINMLKTTSPFSTWSLRKLCLISICFVRKCRTGFLVRLVALVLSYKMGIRPRWTLKSSSCCFSHKIWAQQLPAATYSASAVDKATKTWFFLCQLTKDLRKSDKYHTWFSYLICNRKNRSLSIQLRNNHFPWRTKDHT